MVNFSYLWFSMFTVRIGIHCYFRYELFTLVFDSPSIYPMLPSHCLMWNQLCISLVTANAKLYLSLHVLSNRECH